MSQLDPYDEDEWRPRRWPARLLALSGLGAVLAAIGFGVLGDTALSGADGDAAQPSERAVVVSTNRPRRVVVPACDRDRVDAGTAGDVRRGDTVLSLPKGTGRRVIRIPPCSEVALVVLSRPGVMLQPLGAPIPDTSGPDAEPVVVMPAGRRARVLVVERCPAGSVPEPGRHVIKERRVSNGVAVAPRCPEPPET